MIQGKPPPKPSDEPPEIPVDDDFSQEAHKTYFWGNWRSREPDYPFLYKDDDPPRHAHWMKDDWNCRRYPVVYDSEWAKKAGRKTWEVYLDAYGGWCRERDRLIEVYKRKVEQMTYEESLEVYEGKFPWPPEYPEAQAKVFEYASKGEVVNLAEALEDPTTDVNALDCALWTPIMYAAMDGSLECVEYLMDLGADVTKENNYKDTAMDICVQQHVQKTPDHPVIRFFQSINAPRGHGWRSKTEIPEC